MSALSPGITSGLNLQRELLEQRTRQGEEHCGWKVGFGSAGGLASLGLDGPIIGHLFASGELPTGAAVDIAGWVRPVIEAEIACWIGADVPDVLAPADAGRYIAAVGPAIELADVDHPPEDVERILAGNIYHRSYLLGTPDASTTLAAAAALTARFTQDSTVVDVAEPEELTGHLPQVLARAAALAPRLGRGIRKGDVILLGSIIAPRPVAAGEHASYQLGEFAPLRVDFL